MATLAQLRAEPFWDREITPEPLGWLGTQTRLGLGLPPGAIGIKGNTAHLSGAHRSQDWLRNSRWCIDRQYTVQPGLTAAQALYLAGLDVTPGQWGTAVNRAKVVALTRRVVAAGVAGRLPGVFEFIGSLDGRTAVGFDLPEGQRWPASLDHLEHGHFTFDRRQVNNQAVMERVLAVVLGKDDDVSADDVLAGLREEDEWASPGAKRNATEAGEGADRSALVKLEYALDSVRYKGVQLKAEDRALLGRLDEAAKAENAALATLTTVVVGLVELISKGGGNADLAPVVARLDTLTADLDGLRTDLDGLREHLGDDPASADGGGV